MSLQNKLGGSIFDAGPGVPGIEFADARLLHGRRSARYGRCRRRWRGSWLKSRPGFSVFGPKKGAIAVGSDADLAVLQSGRFVYDSSKAHDGVNWSPFDGQTFTAKVVSDFRAGNRVWNGAEVIGRKDFGQFVPPSAWPFVTY